MKTNNILVVGVTTAVILSLGMTSIYAYGGNGQGNGQGKGQGNGKNMTQEQRDTVQNMSQEERQDYMKANGTEKGQGNNQGNGNASKGEDHNPGDMIANVPSSPLNDKEIEILSYGYSEEMLARDVYNYFYEVYGEEVFKKIADSEQKHMDAVQVLLDRYNLDAPIGYGDLQATFDLLKSEGEQSLKDALGVGLKIEILDIQDIEEAIKNTDNDDFKIVFTNIGGASYNHMRSFVKALQNNNLEITIDYSEFLSQDDLSIRGPLKYKLAERLESEGVELPTQVSSVEMKNKKCDKGNHETNNIETNNNSYINNDLKNQYKKSFETKYGDTISKMSDSELNTLIQKIDVVITKVANGDYSNSIKEKYNAILYALKEIATDNLSVNDVLDINSLFN